MHNITLFTLFVLITGVTNATVCESIVSGLWVNNAIWDCGAAPSNPGNCIDTIIIGEYTYIDDQIDLSGCPPIILIVNDTLIFQSGKKLFLPAGSEIIVHIGGYLVGEGGGGSSNTLSIGGTVFWKTGDGTLVGSIVLDIELTEFYANQINTDVVLYWTTKSEINNDYFTLERCYDGYNFESISIINGAGYSNSEIKYSFLDYNARHGTIYYRLFQTDFDGSTTYSQTIKINYNNEIEQTIFPNPAEYFFSIDGILNEKVQIYSINGRLVGIIESFDGGVIFVDNLKNGIYFVSFIDNDVNNMVKLIIKK